MNAMTVTRYGQESYTYRVDHDPSWNLDILTRVYDEDGATTISFRRGRGDTTASWGPEYAIRSLLGEDEAVAPC